VRVGKADPPDGAHDLGAITVTDGDGCGVVGTQGTYGHAVARLRNRAARMGANYVELVTVVEPHPLQSCFDNTLTIRAMVYRVQGVPPREASNADDACDPPCSPGYACDEGECEPVCNPECAQGQVCRADRTCGPPSHGDTAK